MNPDSPYKKDQSILVKLQGSRLTSNKCVCG